MYYENIISLQAQIEFMESKIYDLCLSDKGINKYYKVHSGSLHCGWYAEHKLDIFYSKNKNSFYVILYHKELSATVIESIWLVFKLIKLVKIFLACGQLWVMLRMIFLFYWSHHIGSFDENVCWYIVMGRMFYYPSCGSVMVFKFLFIISRILFIFDKISKAHVSDFLYFFLKIQNLGVKVMIIFLGCDQNTFSLFVLLVLM